MVPAAVSSAIDRAVAESSYAAYLALAGVLDRAGADGSGLPVLRVAVLHDFTIDALLPVLKGEIARAGFFPELYVSDYDSIMPTVLDTARGFYAFQPTLVIILQWLPQLAPTLSERFPSLSVEQSQGAIDAVVRRTTEAVTAIRRTEPAPILVNNFPLPRQGALGILDAQLEHGQIDTVVRLNRDLRRAVHDAADVHVVDLMSLSARVGSDHGVDDRYWQIGRAPLARPLLLALGQEYGTFIRALRGKVRKCLVLDCDEVLWGGVVGEDGADGLKLGETYPGSCYDALQREVLNLHDRGVILALCSKNNEHDVLDILRTHPDMRLREHHFAAWQINWDDKATNLRRIAEALNIGLDSLVFADDSAFECNLIRRELPEVAVLHLSGDPSSFRQVLQRCGYFDSLVVSREDKDRTQMYRDDRARRELSTAAGSIEEYLASLQLVAEIRRVDDADVARVAQLTQKTNQFNLTTRRYTEGAIHALASRPDADVLLMRVTDRVATLGIVGVAIVTYQDRRAEIETLLLSCRALGRGVERALLAQVCANAGSRGCDVVVGHYYPTARNTQVAHFYRDNGFAPVGGDDATGWTRSLVQGPMEAPPWITLAYS